jgi:D-alanyl-D-alanine carboxypeptidase
MGVGIILTGYLGVRAWDQNQQITSLEQELRDRTALISTQARSLQSASSTISSLRDDLDQVRDDLGDLADEYRDELDRNDEFEDQLRDLAGTLDEFEKLSEIDEELLAKYSKVSFLNENYVPSSLKQIDDEWVLERADIKDQYFHGDAMKFLEDMLERAERAGHDLRIISAYRSFDEQNELKGQFTQVYGEGANAFSADQGFSEHQLGTTVDLTIPSVGATSQTFGDTEAFEWLVENAHRYGFILSYPEDNNFYIYEPWHWRFVGRDLARDLERTDETFYERDQREINKYLLELFE